MDSNWIENWTVRSFTMTTRRGRITALVVSVQHVFCSRCKLEKKFASGQGLTVALILPWNGGDVMSDLLGAPGNSQTTAISLK